MDLPPTLLAAAGVPIPEQMQGRPLTGLLHGAHDPCWPREVYIETSEREVGRAIRTHRWKYAVTAPGLDGKCVARADVYRETALYDLQADPYELNNLVGSTAHRALCDRLGERLIARMVEAGEPAATILPAEPRDIPQASLHSEELDM